MASLDSPITKYNRAREHVETLRRNLEPLRDLDTYVITRDIDDKTGEQIHRFDDVPPMPMGLEVLIGEMLYNFRCSLDHLVWQLVLSEGITNPDQRNEFPIFDDSVDYEAAKKRKLRGVSDTVRAIIDSLQPCYSTGANDYWKWLWYLHRLNNADKHRHLLLTRRALAPIQRVSNFGNKITKVAFFNVPVEKGAIFFRGEPNVNMKVEPSIKVFFSNAPSDIRQDLPIENIIDLIYGAVDEAFRRLRVHVT